MEPPTSLRSVPPEGAVRHRPGEAGSATGHGVALADIEAAAGRLAGQVIDTPCLESRTLGQIVGCRVFLKFENLQFTASFKERGALNKLSQLLASGQPLKGVIAASAGNHAQGVAHHAQRLGLRAVIVMPQHTPTVKVERTRGFGAEVVLHGETFDHAREHALALAAEQGLTFVHPFDDADVICGRASRWWACRPAASRPWSTPSRAPRTRRA
jgi:threonine dehydratase